MFISFRNIPSKFTNDGLSVYRVFTIRSNTKFKLLLQQISDLWIFFIQLNLITLYYVKSKLSFLILNENIVILNLTYPTLPSLSLIKRTQTKANQIISNTTEIVPIKTKPLMFSILFSSVASGG